MSDAQIDLTLTVGNSVRIQRHRKDTEMDENEQNRYRKCELLADLMSLV